MRSAARTAFVAGGLLLLAGGTLQAAAHQSTFAATVDQWPYQLGAWATFVGSAVLAVAVSRSAAVPGIAAALGSVLLAAMAFSQATVNPALVESAPDLLNDRPGATMLVGMGVSTLGFAVGWLVFGIALLRRSGRTAAGIAVVGASVLCLVPVVPGPAVLGLALVWLATSTAPEASVMEPTASVV